MNLRLFSKTFVTPYQSTRCCDAEDNIMIITHSFCGFVITIDLLFSRSITVEGPVPFLKIHMPVATLLLAPLTPRNTG